MVVGGWSRTSQTVVNFGFALMCPLGAALFAMGLQGYSDRQSLIVGCALAFSAGVFLCIALSDLLPEMEFHSHNRLQLTLALLAGIALAWGLRFLEPPHNHSHRAGASTVDVTLRVTKSSHVERQCNTGKTSGDFLTRSARSTSIKMG